MSGSQLGCLEMASLHRVTEEPEQVNYWNDTQELLRWSKLSSSFIILSADVFLLSILMSSYFPSTFYPCVFLFSFLMFSLTADIFQQNLSSNIKVEMWIQSTFQVNDYNEDKLKKTTCFPQTLHVQTFYVLQVKSKSSKETTYIHTQATLCRLPEYKQSR